MGSTFVYGRPRGENRSSYNLWCMQHLWTPGGSAISPRSWGPQAKFAPKLSTWSHFQGPGSTSKEETWMKPRTFRGTYRAIILCEFGVKQSADGWESLAQTLSIGLLSTPLLQLSKINRKINSSPERFLRDYLHSKEEISASWAVIISQITSPGFAV